MLPSNSRFHRLAERQINHLAVQMYAQHQHDAPLVAMRRLLLLFGLEFTLVLGAVILSLLAIFQLDLDTGGTAGTISAATTLAAVILYLCWVDLFGKWFRTGGIWPRFGVLAMRAAVTTANIACSLYLFPPLLEPWGTAFSNAICAAYAIATIGFVFWHDAVRAEQVRARQSHEKRARTQDSRAGDMAEDDFASPWASPRNPS